MSELTSTKFLSHLKEMSTEAELKNVQRFFRDVDPGNKFIGMRMADLFKLAKVYSNMPLPEIKKLLNSEYYEARMGAVSIMDFQARDKKTSAERKKELFDLYIQNYDRINNWDLVDRSAPYVVGGYLADKPRDILYKLAKSDNVLERRTSIVSTYYFIRQDDLADTFKIAEILVNDPHDLIQKAVGSWIREAGKKDKNLLNEFLEKYARVMSATMLRYATEKMAPFEQQYFKKLNKEK